MNELLAFAQPIHSIVVMLNTPADNPYGDLVITTTRYPNHRKEHRR